MERAANLLSGSPASDLTIFPEMTLSGFSMDSVKTETKPEHDDFFSELAAGRGSAVIYGRVRNGSNCARVLSKTGEVLGEYRKRHLFAFAGEDRHYKAGHEQPVAVDINGFRVTPLICYDLRFPYLFWDKAPETDLFAVIANWPASRSVHWQTLLRARAIENQAFTVGVNRTGDDPNVSYSGGSSVYSPSGEEVVVCGGEEGVFTAEISTGSVNSVREEYPFMKDRLR
jgi:predicted amidohydrolase